MLADGRKSHWRLLCVPASIDELREIIYSFNRMIIIYFSNVKNTKFKFTHDGRSCVIALRQLLSVSYYQYWRIQVRRRENSFERVQSTFCQFCVIGIMNKYVTERNALSKFGEPAKKNTRLYKNEYIKYGFISFDG